MESNNFSESDNSKMRLLRATEVAARLSICRASAYQLIKKGVIPSVRFNNIVRVREVDLNEFIQRSWSGWSNS